MANTARSAQAKRQRDIGQAKPFAMPFGRKNITFILIGILVVALGYLLMYMSPTMSFMALTVSPIILLIGYCVIIPYGIMTGSPWRRKETATTPTEPSTNGAA